MRIHVTFIKQIVDFKRLREEIDTIFPHYNTTYRKNVHEIMNKR